MRNALLSLPLLSLSLSFTVAFHTPTNVFLQPRHSLSKLPTKTALHSKKPKGVYTRPSAAIERGSGFYIPGLEGSRVRIIFGAFILILNYVNGFYDPEEGASLVTSQWLAVSYAVLLILLGLVEFGKELGFVSSTSSSSSSSMKDAKVLSQIISDKIDDDTSNDVLNWISASYIALTPATHFLVLNENEILYGLGEDFPNDTTTGISACIETISESKGGRVSIPPNHPGAVLLPPEARKCVLLQRVGCGCIVVGSEDVLQAFGKNDLKWLGVFAKYVDKLRL